jgi:hypothetical protein
MVTPSAVTEASSEGKDARACEESRLGALAFELSHSSS